MTYRGNVNKHSKRIVIFNCLPTTPSCIVSSLIGTNSSSDTTDTTGNDVDYSTGFSGYWHGNSNHFR